ncbi:MULTISPECIES: hypothetical protein [Amycolatopsis]|uniref:hypothetical protein n=2 Tax=Pseudonocardiaceae TaxID=2070 RepID=UPI0013041165|nr:MULTISPECIES: hypothetical protein [Amycolatopsis]
MAGSAITTIWLSAMSMKTAAGSRASAAQRAPVAALETARFPPDDEFGELIKSYVRPAWTRSWEQLARLFGKTD